MTFKQCICKKMPNNHMEYSDLKAGNKFVTVKEHSKVVNQLVTDKDGFRGYKKVPLVRAEFIISYPGHKGPVDVKPEKYKERYFLVVDHTRKAAYAVERKTFAVAYSTDIPTGSKKAIKGDNSLDKGSALDPRKDDERAADNEKKAKRHPHKSHGHKK